MDGFTPTFFLNLVIALLSGGMAYGVLKTDLKNTIAGLAKETQLREKLAEDTDKSLHDIRGDISTVSNKVAALEGERRAA